MTPEQEALLKEAETIGWDMHLPTGVRAFALDAASMLRAALVDAVPREPTEAMIDAAIGIDLIETGWRKGVAILWEQMYDAARASAAEKR